MAAITALHGFSQRGDSWRELAELVPGRRRWLTPDLDATDLDGAVAEVLALWDRVGVERSHLVGYSQGGRVALKLAAAHPRRLLTLTVIGAHAGFEGAARTARLAADAELADRIEREGVDWFAVHWAALPIFAGLARRGPGLLQRLDASRRSHDPAQLAAALRGLGGAAAPPFWDRLPAVTAPTLVIAGAEDPAYVAHARRLADLIPHSRVEIVPDSGHVVHLEQPAGVAGLLADHLRRRARRSTAAPTRPRPASSASGLRPGPPARSR